MTTHLTDSESIVYTLEHRKVARRNQLNLKALKVQKDLKEILTPYLGKKIRRTGNPGGWIKKIDRLINSYYEKNLRYERGNSENPLFRLYLNCDWTWLHCTLDTTYKVSDSAVNYLKAPFCLGKCDENGILIELFDVEGRRTDYTVKEIEQVRKDVKELKEALREKESFLQGLNN